MNFRNLIALCGISALLAVFYCVNPGSGTETGNAKVAGILYNEDGTRAAGAKVACIPRRHNPYTGEHTGGDSTTTDDTGAYKFKTMPVDSYNIIASLDTGYTYIDPIIVTSDANTTVPPDTLRYAGSVQGIVELQPGDDARTVFMIFMGTHLVRMPSVAAGNFDIGTLGEGRYRVRLLTTLDDYDVMDTAFTVRAGVDSVLPQPIVLNYTGIPVPQGLRIVYDTLKQIVTLVWNTPTNGRPVAGYNIYRKHQDSAITILRPDWTDTTYSDSTGIQDITYEYRVSAIDTNTMEGTRSVAVSATVVGMFIVSDSIVKGWAVGVDGNFGHMARGVLDSQGNYYIVDNMNQWLQKFDSTGNFIFKVDTFQVPVSIANHADSFLYVCDDNARNVVRTDLDGNIDTIFSTVGRPSGVCTRGDTIFISSDSGVEIRNLAGDSLDLIRFQFYRSYSAPQITIGTNGMLFVVEDRGLFEVNVQTRTVSSIWTFNDQSANQQAQLSLYNGDTLVIVAPSTAIPGFRGRLYLVSGDGALIARWYSSYTLSGVIIHPRRGLTCFSPGKILFLQR